MNQSWFDMSLCPVLSRLIPDCSTVKGCLHYRKGFPYTVYERQNKVSL